MFGVLVWVMFFQNEGKIVQEILIGKRISGISKEKGREMLQKENSYCQEPRRTRRTLEKQANHNTVLRQRRMRKHYRKQVRNRNIRLHRKLQRKTTRKMHSM